jgi:hypothetical protein
LATQQSETSVSPRLQEVILLCNASRHSWSPKSDAMKKAYRANNGLLGKRFALAWWLSLNRHCEYLLSWAYHWAALVRKSLVCIFRAVMPQKLSGSRRRFVSQLDAQLAQPEALGSHSAASRGLSLWHSVGMRRFRSRAARGW